MARPAASGRHAFGHGLQRVGTCSRPAIEVLLDDEPLVTHDDEAVHAAELAAPYPYDGVGEPDRVEPFRLGRRGRPFRRLSNRGQVVLTGPPDEPVGGGPPHAAMFRAAAIDTTDAGSYLRLFVHLG